MEDIQKAHKQRVCKSPEIAADCSQCNANHGIQHGTDNADADRVASPVEDTGKEIPAQLVGAQWVVKIGKLQNGRHIHLCIAIRRH